MARKTVKHEAPHLELVLAAQILQATISLSLGDDQKAESPEKLLEAMRLTLKYSTCTSHPLFFNQLYGGPEPAGIAGITRLVSLQPCESARWLGMPEAVGCKQ